MFFVLQELLQLVASVFQLIVPVCKLNYTSITNTIEERTDQLFKDWDIHGNGYVYKEDFLQYCRQVRAESDLVFFNVESRTK